MKLTGSFISLCVAFGLVTSLGGCAAQTAAPEEATASTDDALRGVRTADDLTIVGSLDAGGTAEDWTYTTANGTRFDAYKFVGKTGDAVDVTVKPLWGGVAKAWILDNDFHTVARSTGEHGAATIHATLPANDSATHYVVFAEKFGCDQAFRVTLAETAAVPTSCALDADCASLAATADAVPECNNASHTCELVKLTDVQCGGFIRNAHQCAAGWTCQLSSHMADLPGKCVQQCGGIAGLTCSNPLDYCKFGPDCDPAHGGADCMGTCTVCVHTQMCMTTAHWDQTVCACVAN